MPINVMVIFHCRCRSFIFTLLFCVFISNYFDRVYLPILYILYFMVRIFQKWLVIVVFVFYMYFQKLERKLRIAVQECHNYRLRMDSALKQHEVMDRELTACKLVLMTTFYIFEV